MWDKLIQKYVALKATVLALLDTDAKTTKQYTDILTKNINKQISDIKKESTNVLEETIPLEFDIVVEATLNKLNGNYISDSLKKINAEATKELIENTSQYLTSAIDNLGRSLNSIIQQVNKEMLIKGKYVGKEAIKDAQHSLKQKLVDQGILTVQAGKKRLGIDYYSKMVINTTAREIQNRAILNVAQSEGYDLVKVSTHPNPCKICLQYAGRVYSISGKSKEYPSLDVAYSGTHMNLHPNCKHTLSIYIPELDKEQDKTKELSNRPFELTPEQERELQKYNEIQKEKTKINADRKQFERYRMLMPDDCPKTFAGFRKMKLSGSENWSKLKEEYRKNVYIIKKNNSIPWPKNFPTVISHTSVAALKNIKNGNAELHKVAKAGDREAAFKLVSNVLKADKIKDISSFITDKTIITPVIAKEMTGNNKLPEQYANILGHILKCEVTNDIVQVNKSFHTGSDAMHRLLNRAIFDGTVQKGYNYIILDDVMTMGGTLSDIRKYIEYNEGKVILASTLANMGQVKLAIDDELIKALSMKFGKDKLDTFLREVGISNAIEELTYAEGQQLLKFKSIDSIRDRTAKERG